MSLRSTDMAGSALGTAFSLLLLACIIQGVQNFEMFYHEKMEATVGQDIALPCTVKSSTDLKIVSIEWSKNRNRTTKLALYSPVHGHHKFWPNVSIQVEQNSLGSYLNLLGVTKTDSDIYICEITTFPLGSIRRETELKIKDEVKIMCDVDNTVEVQAGENVTIQCRMIPNAQYRWTKNNKLVSENESLELSRVTVADTGVYKLTVNTGNKSLHKEFIIKFPKATTSLRPDPVPVTPQSDVNVNGLTKSTDSSLTTPPSSGLSTTDNSATWTTRMGTDVTDDSPNPSDLTATAGQNMTSYINRKHISITPSSTTHTDPRHFNSSSDPSQSVPRSLSTTLRNSVFRSTPDTTDEPTLHAVHPEINSSASPEDSSPKGEFTENSDNPGAAPTLNTGHTVTVKVEETNGAQSYLLLVLTIPMVVLIALAGFICRKQLIKRRMDMPPPFKPPPPPVKYTSARHHEVSAQLFPTSRCNSITEYEDIKETFINR
uniref:T-cell surface protein tactile n=1 Tax=Scatophagus argus TaxID=75038 RepID=UPI001ED8522C|nr:T-cell surface protein tactile [Scatophagus argus]